MPYALYVCLQDDSKIAVFAIDSERGQLSPRAEVPLAGGPSVMALSPDGQRVYVGLVPSRRSRLTGSTRVPAV